MKKNRGDYRQRIIQMDLLRVIDDVGFSERDKEIVNRYMRGERCASLSRAFKLSKSRVPQILNRYIVISKDCLVDKEIEEGCPFFEIEQRYDMPAGAIERSLLLEKQKEEMRLNKLYGIRKRKREGI